MKIGLEVHVQLPTRSKMFCSCPTTDAEAPNTHVCPTCLGMPGSRPVLNRKALEYGVMLAKMLNCTIPEATWFSRKTYFYPDMSKSVQITQYDHPVGSEGFYVVKGKKIRITRIQLEEDPGKTKRVGDLSSLVDYNRSGMPLVEIVTEPDMSAPAEAREFLGQLIADIRHVIDLPGDGERSIRCDCNISVGKERCEVKNVTGLKNVERALNFELVRQTKVLKAGGKVDRETRRFDEERGVTISVRKKELEADYGYIDEPDLGIFHIGRMAESIKIKESPQNMALRLASQHGIDEKTARQVVSTSVGLAELFEDVVKAVGPDAAKSWIGAVAARWKEFEGRSGDRAGIVDILKDLSDGRINDVEAGMRLKSYMAGTTEEDVKAAFADLDALIEGYIDANLSILEEIRRNEKASNRIIGHVMKETGGAFSSTDIVSAVKMIVEKRL
ncbi:MAG: Asp-tRNA(Asn)/Glu-tRNA(Gln) amidotransferase subunit GatB [Candidatus Methanoplasma sp.]|nr:Asp-tRNA(Asn)/Glu-tRNA(Gln) amidotransferase subunit GatB [Candidatus Methanoplasma sp.]